MAYSRTLWKLLRSPLEHPSHQTWRFLAQFTVLVLVLPVTTATPSLAQQVIDGLPPAPLPPAQPYAVPGNAPAVSVPPPVGPATAPAEVAPAVAPVTPIPGARSYVVVVDGDSPLLLSQVQQVVPTATVVPIEGRSLIQAGVFPDEGAAAQQVQQLAARGITSRVVAAVPVPESQPTPTAQVEGFPIPELPSTVVPREVEFESLPTLNDAGASPSAFESESDRSYYVVIPGHDDDLADISEQVVRMAYGFRMTRLVEERDSPLGPHVLVGPFSGRGAAERWNTYFRDFGMNSRVYFKR